MFPNSTENFTFTLGEQLCVTSAREMSPTGGDGLHSVPPGNCFHDRPRLHPLPPLVVRPDHPVLCLRDEAGGSHTRPHLVLVRHRPDLRRTAAHLHCSPWSSLDGGHDKLTAPTTPAVRQCSDGPETLEAGVGALVLASPRALSVPCLTPVMRRLFPVERV